MLTVALLGTLWWRKDFFLLYFFHLSPPSLKPELTELQYERMIVRYTKDQYLKDNIDLIAKRMLNNLFEAEEVVGHQLSGKLQVYLFADWEKKGNFTDDMRISHADSGKSAVYCIMNADWDGVSERMEFKILMQQAHGKPFHDDFDEYIASGLSGTWFQKSLEDWASFLLSRDLAPSFPEMFRDRQYSRFLTHPWNALLARFILQEYGLDALVTFYKSGILPEEYSERWNHWLSRFPVRKIETTRFAPEFQKGITYAYSNSYEGGYATTNSAKSQDELKSIGVQWLASIPYGFMRKSHAELIRFPGNHPAGESDESLWALASDARDRNMKVMLKPQIWIGHVSWPGKIDFDSQEKWDRWMDNYEKWIIHYAIIAELSRADLLCIGTELVQATLKNPERWREMIRKIRNVYHGPLTYAANWGREFEQMQFWDELDYMGLDNYYPVRSIDNDSLNHIQEGFVKQKARIKTCVDRFKKPLLFTEVGFMANSRAGTGPAEYEGTDYDEALQKTCYRFTLETYWNEPWFFGMYWWKWFSDPYDRGKAADPHSPHDRAAEKILAEWYRKDPVHAAK